MKKKNVKSARLSSRSSGRLSANLLYVTTCDLKEARKIARSLIRKKLAACANIFPKMESIYCWQDKIKSESESVLILKTSRKNTSEVIHEIQKIHSYQTPCILSLRIDRGSTEYLKWINNQI